MSLDAILAKEGPIGAGCDGAKVARRALREGGRAVKRPMGVLIAFTAATVACGSNGSTSTPTAPSPTETPASPLVGTWSRVTTCDESFQAFTRAGFEESVIEEHVLPGLADPSNGWLPGGQIADPTHPCEGAVPREHSHFWTEFGTFGSFDWKGNQVDEGTYEIIDDETLVMPYGFEQGPPIQVELRYQIRGDTLTLDPVIPSDCSTKHCLEAALWSVSVAYPGETWERVS
jgi:hypothetical protein